MGQLTFPFAVFKALTFEIHPSQRQACPQSMNIPTILMFSSRQIEHVEVGATEIN
jgi:hypothetical protein